MVVVDAEVWELKLPRLLMAGIRGRAAPPRAACRAAADARAHAFDELCCPRARCDKQRRVEMVLSLIKVSGCALRLEVLRR